MQSRSGQVYLLAVVALGLVLVLAGAALAQSSIPTNIGTWKLNIAKSKLPASIPYTSVTLRIEAAGAGVTHTVETLTADGAVEHLVYTASYDGKDSPIVGGGSSGVSTVALTRVDAYTTRSIFKEDGRVTLTQTAVVSRDGKRMTLRNQATIPEMTLDFVYVFDKQ